jgi:serine phosphatase RsbU (regulator of sigma subunit)
MGLIRSLIRIFTEIPDAATRGGRPAEHPADPPFDPMRAVGKINHYLETHHGHEGIFATLFFGILTLDTGQITYVNAGHESPLLIAADGRIRALAPTAPAVGMMLETEFATAEIDLQPGDTLIAFTDGVTEAGRTPASFFGTDGIRRAIARARAEKDDYLSSLEQALFEHLDGSDLTDDIAMIAVSRRTIDK